MPALLVAVALLGLALGVIPLSAPSQLAVLLSALVALMVLARRRAVSGRGLIRRGGAVILVLLLSLAWGWLHRPQPGPNDPVRRLQESTASTPIRLVGTLLRDGPSQPAAEGCSLPLQTEGGRVQLRLIPCQRLQEGWRLAVSGELSMPLSGPHPLLAGQAQRLAREGIWSELRVRQLQVLRRPFTPVADLRRRMATTLIGLGGPDLGGLWAALVLGSAVVPVPQEVRESFRVAGLSHALAASGFHLTVLLGAVMALARPLAAPLRWLAAAGAMGVFLLLAGPQPSVVRAVVMAAVAFVVLESGRRSRPLGILALTVLAMLLWSPSWLLDLGFQLSVAATAGLMLTARDLEGVLRRGLPPWLAAALSVPVAACLWTLPLQLLHFGALPLYAVPANLLAAPLLSPLTLGAMALALLSVLPAAPPLLALLVAPLAPLTRLLLWMSQGVAGLPLAQWQLGRPLPWLVLLITLGLLPWVLPAGLRGPQAWSPRRWGAALLLVASLVHAGLLLQDQLLLVHQPRGDLLVARHGGRAALVSTSGDARVCRQAAQLAVGLGVQRYDWVVVLDPVAAETPRCWRQLTPTWLAGAEGMPALQPGQRLESPGLVLSPIGPTAWGHELRIQGNAWVLLPDRQSFWAWWQTRSGRRDVALWLGFVPRLKERQQLIAAGIKQVWISGEAPARAHAWPSHWRASGASGSLQAGIR